MEFIQINDNKTSKSKILLHFKWFFFRVIKITKNLAQTKLEELTI